MSAKKHSDAKPSPAPEVTTNTATKVPREPIGKHTSFKIRLRKRMQLITPWQWVALFAMSVLWLMILMPTVGHKVLTAKDIEAMPVPVDEERERTLKQINKHLQYVEKQKELNQMDAQLQNYEMEREIDPRRTQALVAPSDDNYERLKEDQQEKSVYEDLRGGPQKSFDTPMTPEERINANIAMRKWMTDYQEHQTQQYVQEFIDNARKQGLEVKINNRLEVVDIRPIPKEQRYKGMQSIRGLSSQ